MFLSALFRRKHGGVIPSVPPFQSPNLKSLVSKETITTPYPTIMKKYGGKIKKKKKKNKKR